MYTMRLVLLIVFLVGTGSCQAMERTDNFLTKTIEKIRSENNLLKAFRCFLGDGVKQDYAKGCDLLVIALEERVI